MSRALTAVVLVTLLAGCATAPPPVIVEVPATADASCASMQEWLFQQQKVSGMETDEVVANLVRLSQPEGIDQLFYYGLLNQQLQTNGAWAQARDSFRELQQSDGLTTEQRQLTGILLAYNQNRINWYQRQSELLVENAELEKQLQQAEEDKVLLEQKIQALTDLEADISTRKEQ
jgi:hypothetical protein